ncbi:S8 family peptidase [Methanolobus sp. WCC1]|uniref:S8 family peptidase n=1 Tax=unclassified Methanolobus TaxID=2629569 RepID=UPI0032502CCB
MESKHEHLGLSYIPDSFVRRPPRFPGGPKKTNKTNQESADDILQSFNQLKDDLDKKKKLYPNDLKPHLIFKIETNQDVHEETFKAHLRRAGISIISTSPDKKGFWVAFSADDELNEFRRRLDKHVQEDSYKFIYSIEKFEKISPEEKEGDILKKEPFGKNEISYLNVEIWRMSDATLNVFIMKLNEFIFENGGEVTDLLTKNSFCLLRIKMNWELYNNIIQWPEVKQIDRIPRIKIESILSKDIDELFVDAPPSDDSCGVLVLDSGILSNHPLLEKCVAYETVAKASDTSELSDDFISDDVGHGTEVAGIAVYGDLKNRISTNNFSSDVWLFSVKILFNDGYGYATFNEKELVEHQLDNSVREIVSAYPNCKIVNISFGNEEYIMFEKRHQFTLASLLDELSKELDIIFVVSAGNYGYAEENSSENYPNHLLNKDGKTSIIDPATAALAITVGSLYKEANVGLARFCKDDDLCHDYPSPRTRVGPGFQGMVKPDFVEYGGGYGEEADVVTLNYNWIKEGKLFSHGSGTSLSAPKVAYFLAQLINKYPYSSLNLIKALLLSSAKIPIPEMRPSPLSEIDFYKNAQSSLDLLKIYGYGKPDLNRALFSESNRVLLTRENRVKLNNFHIYELYLPEDFSTHRGNRKIDVTFVYNPPVNKNRIDYLGSICEVNLFKNIDLETLKIAYEKLDFDNIDDDLIPNQKEVQSKKIDLHPGVNLRKKGVHQRCSKIFKQENNIDTSNPLYLVVVCKKRWINDDDYEQDYAVIVTIEYEDNTDIYDEIRLRNTSRVRLRQ